VSFADDRLVYRDLTGEWGTLRLFIGGRDVTRFRGVPAQVGSYQLTEPYGYGPAQFRFPQLTSLEVNGWGVGDLDWFDLGRPARLVQVDPDGNRVVVWKGFVSQTQVSTSATDTGVEVHCDGEASGRLALRDRHPALFHLTKDVGTWVADAFAAVHLPMTPPLGITTGIELDTRERSGTMLSYVDSLLADAQTRAGDQLTVMPTPDASGYTEVWKDRATVHATAYNGAPGVEVDLTRDLQEEPTTFYGSGRDPDGLLWLNAKAPGLIQGTTPSFPGTLSPGDAGGNVEVAQHKLWGMGYLTRREAVGPYDDETADAVKALQDDAGLPRTGVIDSATWDALFDLEVTGLSLLQARQLPLAELPAVRRYNLTSNGSWRAPNPAYDPTRVAVDRTLDFGNIDKRLARTWCQRELDRVQGDTVKNWVGTITLSADVFAGEHNYGNTGTILSRLDLRPGMNLRLHHFDGTTRFHIAGVDVSSDLTVRLAVDTKARDLLTVGQIIDRNRESRIHPARQWLRERRRGTDANQRIVEFSEIGGKVFTRIDCPGGAWTVFPVVAGESGSVNRIRLKVESPATEFVVGVTAFRTTPAWWRAKVGNPFQASVRTLHLTSSGSGYTSAPTVTFTGGGGGGAAATATVTDGHVTAVTLTAHGGGYEETPTVEFTGGGGSGASAEARLHTDAWTSEQVRKEVEETRVLLGAWGDQAQPCGYYPGTKHNEDGKRTDDPVTGVFLDAGGFDYYTFVDPVLYVAVYPRVSTSIEPQRVLWPVLEAGT
jgi:peptidoglycan hydrolase-like protein with peptidoglycan-binding domain